MISLMFHDIRNDDSDFFPKRYSLPYFLDWREFEYRIELLSKQYNFIDLAKLSSGSFASNDVLLTFDDGLKDHLFVSDYLYKKGIPGVFFVPVEPVKDRVIMQTHAIQFIQAAVGEEVLVKRIMNLLEQQSINARECYYKYSISLWKNNLWSNDMVFTTRILREYGNSKWREETIDSLYKEYISSINSNIEDEFYLSIQDLHRIKSMGFNIGGHGYKSLDLLHQSEAEIDREIALSKRFLCENKIGGEILSLSYPNGGFNDKIVETVRRYGISYAFTTTKEDYLNQCKLTIPRFDGTIDFQRLFAIK